MSVILARIDDRLIHGQVTEGWCSKLKPENVLVVSDEIDSSDWHRELCLASLPCCFDGTVVSVQDAAQAINRLIDDPEPSYVLFESPKDAYTVVHNGARLKRINVGGMHSKKGKREILEYLFVDEADSLYLRKLEQSGVELDFRDLPDHENADVMSRL